MTLKTILDRMFLASALIIFIALLLLYPYRATASELFPGVAMSGQFEGGNTNYYDGIDLSGGNPSAKVEGRLTILGNVFVDASLANMDAEHRFINAEADGVFTGGLTNTFNLGFGEFGGDVEVTRVMFFNDSMRNRNQDFWDYGGHVFGDVHGFALRGGIVYSDNVLNGLGKRMRYEGEAKVPLLWAKNDFAELNAFGAVGYNDFGDLHMSYTDYRVGLEADRGPWFGRVFYADNNLSQPIRDWLGKPADARVGFEIGAKLD